MKKIEKIATAENFNAISVGKLNELDDYVLTLAPDAKIHGKVFCGASLDTTGSEFSFQMFRPGAETGFLHTHKKHEELYFFLSGIGEFQVDGKVFPISEGSIVRVAPAGKRSVRNNGTTPLIMLCVQYMGATFTTEDASDGNILNEPVKW
ncbi:MAG: cupin domain-containing protein [Prevotella sp.]|jgi:mannose-6-phosphate isomerase-like protein (cupin superfamily)|nr:cupin domain-containing protein [Prevotella sp.]